MKLAAEMKAAPRVSFPTDRSGRESGARWFDPRSLSARPCEVCGAQRPSAHPRSSPARAKPARSPRACWRLERSRALRRRRRRSPASRTSAPARRSRCPTRVGGFGGVEGLDALSRRGAHHPCRRRDASFRRAASPPTPAPPAPSLGVPLLVLRAERPGARRRAIAGSTSPTTPPPSRALGEAPRRVFLTIGRQGVADFRAAPQHDYLLRVIEPPLTRTTCRPPAR